MKNKNNIYVLPSRPHYGRSFELATSLPLIGYAVNFAVLVGRVLAGITGDALKIAATDPAMRQAVLLSLVTSVASTALAVVMAIPSGYILSRCDFRGKAFVDTLVDLPIVLPPLVMGLAVLIFFNTGLGRWLDRGIWPNGIFVYQPLGIVLVQFIIGGAYAIRVIKSGFDAQDSGLRDIALTLGAKRRQAFFKVELPNIIPSLVAGAVIAWARIFGLFGPVLLIAGTMRGRTEIMPTTIFLETSIGRIEVALVVGALMILISGSILMLLKRLGRMEDVR
jgi:molybdate transport system permease protein